MGDIFDQLPASSPGAAAGGGDIFDRVSAAPPTETQRKPNASELLPHPQLVDQAVTQAARDFVAGRPGPPRPPLPAGILGEPTTSGEFQNPRTGHISRGAPLGTGPLGFLDAPVTGAQQIGQGIEQMAEPGLREKAGGLHKIISGGFEAATPAMVAGGVTAPVKTAVTVGAAMAAQKGTEIGLKYLGLPAEYSDLAGDLTGLVAGAVAHGKISRTSIRDWVKPILEDRAVKKAAAAKEQQYTSTGQPVRSVNDEVHPEGTTGAEVEPQGGGGAGRVAVEGAESGGGGQKPAAAVEPTPVSGSPGEPVAEKPQQSGAEQPRAVLPPAAESLPAPKGDGALKQFWGEEAGTSNVGAQFRADMKDVAGLKAKRDAALDELEKEKADPASQKKAERLSEYYMAQRDLWSARVNQVMDRLRKLVPDRAEREAISIYRDYKRTPWELGQWLDGTHPAFHALEGDDYTAARKSIERLRPAIELAMNPTDRMKTADATLTTIADASWREGQRLGFIERGLDPERYFTHLLNPKGEGEVPQSFGDRIGKALGGQISRRYAFAQQREYRTVLDAVADNVVPKTLDPFTAFTIHGDKFAVARATHLLIEQLRDSNMGKWDSTKGKNVPDNWVRLAAHSDEFKNEIPETDASGEPIVAHQDLWVHPIVAKALRPITDPNYMHVVKGFTNLRIHQASLKLANLSLSFFHARAENLMALGNMGPRGWIKGLRADRDSGEFLQAERDFIIHGGTSPIQGRTVEAYHSLEPGSIPSWTDIWRKAQPLKGMDALAKKITDLTFDNLQRKFKITDYTLHTSAWLSDHPNATPAELVAAKTSIAKELNAVYGGLNWERLGVNHASVEVARALMLAPDWTFSNIFNLKYAMERGTPAGKMARMFWARTLIGGMASTQLMSLLFTGKPSSNLTQVSMGKDKDGQEIYQNIFFAGASSDAISLINNVDRYGYGAVLGAARVVGNKMAPLIHLASDLQKNEDFLGHQIVPPGMHPVASTAIGAAYVARNVLPIPYSMQNLKNMLIGPEADKYKWLELPATLISGNPPRHVAPDGMRMTKQGLREKREKPRRDIFEEITSGKR